MENSFSRSYRALTLKSLLIFALIFITQFVHAQSDSVLVYIREVHLVPVKNIGVTLKDPRHFVISKIPLKDSKFLLLSRKALKYSAHVVLLLKLINKQAFLLIAKK